MNLFKAVAVLVAVIAALVVLVPFLATLIQPPKE